MFNEFYNLKKAQAPPLITYNLQINATAWLYNFDGLLNQIDSPNEGFSDYFSVRKTSRRKLKVKNNFA